MGCRSNRNISNEEWERQIEETISSLEIEGEKSNQIRIQNAFKNAFKKALQISFKETRYSENTDSILVDIFETKDKYVFIRFKADIDNNKVGLFRIDENEINLVFEETVGNGFSLSNVDDINGDNYLDVITSFYSPSGCCMRLLVKVRLYNPEINTFEKGIEFMNPTFDAKNKFVRGIKYGHSGTVPTYKYKWQNLKIDTVEYIHPNPNGESQYLKSKGADKEKYEINELPKEYLKIEGIDWFLGK
jgi:hypothetical protein